MFDALKHRFAGIRLLRQGRQALWYRKSDVSTLSHARTDTEIPRVLLSHWLALSTLMRACTTKSTAKRAPGFALVLIWKR